MNVHFPICLAGKVGNSNLLVHHIDPLSLYNTAYIIFQHHKLLLVSFMLSTGKAPQGAGGGVGSLKNILSTSRHNQLDYVGLSSIVAYECDTSQTAIIFTGCFHCNVLLILSTINVK